MKHSSWVEAVGFDGTMVAMWTSNDPSAVSPWRTRIATFGLLALVMGLCVSQGIYKQQKWFTPLGDETRIDSSLSLRFPKAWKPLRTESDGTLLVGSNPDTPGEQIWILRPHPYVVTSIKEAYIYALARLESQAEKLVALPGPVQTKLGSSFAEIRSFASEDDLVSTDPAVSSGLMVLVSVDSPHGTTILALRPALDEESLTKARFLLQQIAASASFH